MTDAYERVVVGHYSDGRNMVINKRTAAMIELVEFRLGFPLTIVQGSYNTGGVSASAGTHDGGGVVDFRTWDLSGTDRDAALAVLRQVGFYSWYRTSAQGFSPHIHVVAKGDAELSPAAYQQTIDAEAGYNGLASHLYDGLNLNVPTFNYTEWTTMLDSILSEIQGLRSEERNRYTYYAGKFNAILNLIDTATAEIQADEISRYTSLATTLAALRTLVEALPDTPETEAAALTRYNALQGELSAIKTAVDTLPDAPEAETAAASRFTALQSGLNAIQTAVDALPKA